jgi:heme-degrading monooxygenase HmoA
MEARAQTYSVHPGQTAARLQHSAAHTRPAVRRQPGLRLLLDLVDYATDRTLIVSLWESRQQLQAGLGNPEFVASLPYEQFAAGPVTTEEFEVGRLDLGSGAEAARVIRYTTSPEQSDERLRHAAERLHPILARQPGYAGVVDLLDRAAGKILIVQLFDSMPNARALDGNREFLDALPPHRYEAGDLAIEYFTVAHCERVGDSA